MVTTLTKDYIKECSWKPDLFKGKVCLVTGGSGTICRVQVEALALLGCNVVIVSKDIENSELVEREVIELTGRKDSCFAIKNVDVRDYLEMENCIKITIKKYGKLDFLIAAAAGNFVCDFANLSANAFKSVISIDLLGSFNITKAALPYLVKSKGSILFISSTFHKYGVPFQGPVGAAKSGIDALSNNLAVELGPFGVRSNCIQPGAIKDTEGFRKLSNPKYVNDIIKKIPLQRLGTKKDIAEATVFLFSPSANYINGEIITVDGGMWHTGTLFATSDMYPKQIYNGMEKFLNKARL